MNLLMCRRGSESAVEGIQYFSDILALCRQKRMNLLLRRCGPESAVKGI
jgi:hypothetical protein